MSADAMTSAEPSFDADTAIRRVGEMAFAAEMVAELLGDGLGGGGGGGEWQGGETARDEREAAAGDLIGVHSLILVQKRI